MFEGLKDHREGAYHSKRNQNNNLNQNNNHNDESNRANTMGDHNGDHTLTNPSPSTKKTGSRKYGLSRRPDSWAKRMANNIEADKAAAAAAKDVGEKNSAAVNSRNIDLLAIAQDVIDARSLLCRVTHSHSHYLLIIHTTYILN